jgi:imidazolonepropionase-like amidohydrolase
MATTLIHNGTLIDGKGGAPLRNAAVLVQDNKIRAVGRKADVAAPAEATVLDAKGGYILPGFIDTHVHIMIEGYDLIKGLNNPFSLRFYQVIDRLRRTIEAGVTSVRDAGGADAGVKMAIEQGLMVGPRLQISITGLSITGGHGDSWRLSGQAVDDFFMPYPGLPDGICDGVESVRRKAREVLRAGAEVLKVHVTGGVMSPTDRPEFTQFSMEELKAIVEEGQFRGGIKAMAHAQGAAGINQAIRAGIASIEHGILLNDESIELMLKHGTFLVPTLLAPVGVIEIGEKKGTLAANVLQKARDVIQIHHDNTAKAFKAGVKIAMGTDTGVTNHGDNLRELALMCGIGMSPMQAIVATTKVAAECLGWQDKLGTVEPGKLADIVIAGSDPLADIRSLEKSENIMVVMKDGKVLKDIRS